MADVAPPQFVDGVDLRYFIEGYTGPTHPTNLLDRFPDSVYSKSPDSHFLRFMYALLGPTGTGWLRLALLLARLNFEASGTSTSDLEAAYGDPFRLARNVEESYANYDLAGLLPASIWARIEAQDESYRSRAIQYLQATRFGGTPEGMALAASSGTGANCEIIENYKYLFDQHSDERLGFLYYGQTFGLNEFIVVPRVAVSKTTQQTINFPTGVTPTSFTLTYNGCSITLGVDSDANDVQNGLWSLPSLGPYVHVTGGPAPHSFLVTFTGILSNRPVYPIVASYTTGTALTVEVTTGGVDPSMESVFISDQDKHAMQTALDYLRPVTSIPTYHPDFSTLRFQPWATISASSELPQVVRFVTGSSSVQWPTTDSTHWIVTAQEIEAPRNQANPQAHYVGLHNILSVTPYTDLALSDANYATSTSVLANYQSVHIGSFPEMANVIPYFNQFTDPNRIFSGNEALADYAESLTVSTQGLDGTAVINTIYPADYINLPGVPNVSYHDDHFWSSVARTSGAEILEIDLGSPQAVNYISMEVSRKPVIIEVDYDLLDQSPSRRFVPVNLLDGPEDNTYVFFEGASNPWQYMEYYFNDGQGMIFTRFIRIVLTRRLAEDGFLFNVTSNTQTPWSIEVRNLRIGRNVPPSIS